MSLTSLTMARETRAETGLRLGRRKRIMKRLFQVLALLTVAAISLHAQNPAPQPVHFSGGEILTSLAYGPAQFYGSFEYFSTGHSWTVHVYPMPGTPDLSLGLAEQNFQGTVSTQTANGLLTISIGSDSFWKLYLWAAEPFVRNAFMEATEHCATQSVTITVSSDGVSFSGKDAQ
jgi:hypothetical protein